LTFITPSKASATGPSCTESLNYCCLPCMRFMMKSSTVALLVGRANAIASIGLE